MPLLRRRLKKYREELGVPQDPEPILFPGYRFHRLEVDGHSFCLIERKSGDIYKAAGSRSPRGAARGTLMSPDFGVGCLTWYGVKEKRPIPGTWPIEYGLFDDRKALTASARKNLEKGHEYWRERRAKEIDDQQETES